MGKTQRNYEKEFKAQAVRLVRETGTDKAGEGRLDAGSGMLAPESVARLEEELSALREQAEAQEREIRRLKEENRLLFGTPKAPGRDGTGPDGTPR